MPCVRLEVEFQCEWEGEDGEVEKNTDYGVDTGHRADYISSEEVNENP